MGALANFLFHRSLEKAPGALDVLQPALEASGSAVDGLGTPGHGQKSDPQRLARPGTAQKSAPWALPQSRLKEQSSEVGTRWTRKLSNSWWFFYLDVFLKFGLRLRYWVCGLFWGLSEWRLLWSQGRNSHWPRINWRRCQMSSICRSWNIWTCPSTSLPCFLVTPW